MNQDLFLQEAILRAIKTGEPIRLEANGNKAIYLSPNAAYDLDKEIVEIHGSAEINYLKGVKKRSMEKIWVKNTTIWVTKNFEIIARGTSERIEEKIRINESPSLISKDDLETPPFYKDKHTL